MKNLSIAIISLLLLSCQQNRTQTGCPLPDGESIISITANYMDLSRTVVIFSKPEHIRTITAAINSNQADVIKFRPSLWLNVIRKEDTIRLGINGTSMKVSNTNNPCQGIYYRLDNNIDSVLSILSN